MKEMAQQLSFDPLLRRYYQTRTGCVIRALESLLDVQASSNEWDERIAQIQNWGSGLDLITGEKQITGKNDLIRWYDILGQDMQWLLDFISARRDSETPFGNAIKKYSVNPQLLGRRAIERRLLTGSLVLLLGEKHAANLGYVSPGRFINISDGMVNCNLRDKTLYDVILFDKIAKTGNYQVNQLTLI